MRGKRLGEIDVPALFRLWASGMPEREICQTLGIRCGSFYVVKARLKLPPRPKAKPEDEFAEVEPPTPEEIAERAAAIRSTWSPEEEERRRVGRPTAFRLRNYNFDRRSFAYSEST
jgi:hypothetical protein